MGIGYYRIPIEVSAGRGGLQPSIVFSRSLPMSVADGELPAMALDGPDIDGHLRGKQRRVLAGEAGVLGGVSTTMAGLAAAGSLTLAFETGGAGAGEKTALEVAEAYTKKQFGLNVHVSDVCGWVRDDYARK